MKESIYDRLKRLGLVVFIQDPNDLTLDSLTSTIEQFMLSLADSPESKIYKDYAWVPITHTSTGMQNFIYTASSSNEDSLNIEDDFFNALKVVHPHMNPKEFEAGLVLTEQFLDLAVEARRSVSHDD